LVDDDIVAGDSATSFPLTEFVIPSVLLTSFNSAFDATTPTSDTGVAFIFSFAADGNSAGAAAVLASSDTAIAASGCDTGPAASVGAATMAFVSVAPVLVTAVLVDAAASVGFIFAAVSCPSSVCSAALTKAGIIGTTIPTVSFRIRIERDVLILIT